MSHPSDVRLIARNTARLETFYREHIEAVQSFLARRVSDPHVIADLTANVFLAAISSADRYDPARGAPRAWLFGIARTVVAAEARQHARELGARRRMSGRDLLDEDDINRLLDRIHAETQTRTLLASINRLPPSERAVLELVAVDELTIAEVAKVLSIKRSAARVRLHRARKCLRAQLEQPDHDGQRRALEVYQR